MGFTKWIEAGISGETLPMNTKIPSQYSCLGHDIGLLFRSHPNNGISALPIYKYVEIEVMRTTSRKRF